MTTGATTGRAGAVVRLQVAAPETVAPATGCPSPSTTVPRNGPVESTGGAEVTTGTSSSFGEVGGAANCADSGGRAGSSPPAAVPDSESPVGPRTPPASVGVASSGSTGLSAAGL